MSYWRTVLAFEVEPEFSPWEFSFKTKHGLFYFVDFEQMRDWSAWGPALIVTPDGRKNLDYFDLDIDVEDSRVNCLAPGSGDQFDFGKYNSIVIDAYKKYLGVH